MWLMSWKTSQVAGNVISSTLQTSVTSDVSPQEEKCDTITFPLTSSVPESIKKFIQPEELTGASR